MTTHVITFDANVFTDEDGHEPATIELRAQAFRPAGWEVPLGGDAFAVKNLLEFSIDPDEPTIELEATGVDDWCWHVGVRHPDLDDDNVWERFFYLNADTNFNDLVDLDPYTLDPAAEPTAAWSVELESRVPEDGTDGFVLTKGTPDNVWAPAGAGGGGDVVGPASSDDMRVVTMDGATGKLIQQSPVSIDDAGAITGMTTVDGRDVSVDGTKLDGIAPGATANATDAALRDRATHTGTQPAGTITGLAPIATSGLSSDLSGLIPTALLPPLAINETFVVASQAAMLALVAQRGDMAIRTDNGKTYVLSSDSPSTLADWKEVLAAGQVQSVNAKTGVVTLNQDEIPDGTTAKQYTATEKTKLAGIATGATANSTDAQLRDRTTHTGVQAISTVSGLQPALDALDLEIAVEEAARIADVNAEEAARIAALLAYKRIQPNTVALLGASIANMGGGDLVGTSPLTRADGFFPWANASLGGRLTLVKNAGVGGNTSAQILARVTDVTGLATMPGYCILPDCATNDLVAGTASATIITNLQAICDALQAKGITVVICTVLPIAGNAAHVQRQEEVSRWIRDRSEQPGFIVCDWAARWGDPTTVGPKAGYSTDGVHPTPVGAGAIGRVLAEALRPHLGGSIELASHNLDQLTINLNPMMVGTGGTASTGTSGSVATNWTTLRGSGAGTLAASKVARNAIDGIGGEWQKLELAGGGGMFFLYSDVAAAAISGQKLQAELEFEAADFSGITDFRLVVENLAGAGGFGLYQLTPAALPVDISSGLLRTPEFTVPAGGPFTARTMLLLQGTAGSVKVSRFRTRKVA